LGGRVAGQKSSRTTSYSLGEEDVVLFSVMSGGGGWGKKIRGSQEEIGEELERIKGENP